MADNKEKTDNRDRSQINVNEPYELQYWSEKFNVTPDELRNAVERAGTQNADQIEQALNSRKSE